VVHKENDQLRQQTLVRRHRSTMPSKRNSTLSAATASPAQNNRFTFGKNSTKIQEQASGRESTS
jgi:hypothetical protein